MEKENEGAKGSQILGELETYVEKTRMSLGDCAAAIVVSRGDEVVLEKYIQGAYEGEIGSETLWPIFSATKALTAGVLLSAAWGSVIGLDDPVGKYLPAFNTKGEGPYDRREVTIRHLASFTAGTIIPPEKYTPSKGQPPDLELVQIDTESGKEFDYALLQMHLLEAALEAATGEDFEATLQKQILRPLGLMHSCYVYEYPTDLPILPGRKNDTGDPAKSFYLSAKGIRTSTGLFMTALELNRYGQVWLGDGTYDGQRYFSSDLKKEAWRVHAHPGDRESKYGLLWWIHGEDGGYVMSGWGGKTTVVLPEHGVVITVIRNPPTYPEHGPFDYYGDQRALIGFGKRLGEAQ